ncbi:MAG: C4-dicarboxylate ABC transporter [Pseudomonas sp. BICA1-14]|nr:TRAP transporter small permease [[Pseudomonas] sp. BICA1-14]KJS78753.1 MAG: C4-dicarboxylate ABC transporter [[Pseudomonas] sp. BICA1-14]
MNNKTWYYFSEAIKRCNAGMAYVSALLIVACTLVLVYEVVTRYLLKISNDWVIELSIFMLISATFLAAAQTQRERAHVGIEVLDEVMSAKWNRWRYLLGDVLSMLFCAFVAYQSWLYWHEAWDGGWESSSAWAPKLWIPYIFMAIGMSLLTLQFVVQIIEQLALKASDAEQIAASHQHQPSLGD